MQIVDLTSNARMDVLLGLVKALSRADDPRQVLEVFADGLRRLNGPRGYVSVSVRGLAPGHYKVTRFLHDDDEAGLLSQDPWMGWNRLATHVGGIIGHVIADGLPKLLHHMNITHDPVFGDELKPYQTMLAIPLFDRGEPINWAVFLVREPTGYSVAEAEEALLRGNLVGGTVRTTLLAKQLQEANTKIAQEVNQIARIQRALLPERLPLIPGVTLGADFHTYDQAGGDIYDVAPLRDVAHQPEPIDMDTTWGLLIADASGHGPAATTVTAMLHAILHAFPRRPSGPGEVLEYANRHLCAKRIEASFVTAFMALYHPPTRRLTYARAGHPPALLRQPGNRGQLTRLDEVGSFPLGILSDATYEDAVIQLKEGQTLVLYTDGIIEAMNQKQEPFGIEGIERALADCTGDPGCTVDKLNKALRIHEQGHRPGDDQTMLVMQVGACY